MNPPDNGKPDSGAKSQVESVAPKDSRKAKAIARGLEMMKAQPPFMADVGVGQRTFQALEAGRAVNKPSWDFWCAKGNAKFWQAPLLSLDRDPSGVIFNNNNWAGLLTEEHLPQDTNLPPAFDERFKQRLWLLWKAVHSNRKYFPNNEYFGFPQPQDDVSLDVFAAWCEISKLEIPPQLHAISKAYGGVARLQEEVDARRKGEVIGWYNETLVL